VSSQEAKNKMKTIDPGHKYELATLDGGLPQTLTFVKRHDEENPDRFPGNTESHPGTTLQNVIRALLERFRYLQNQHACLENAICITFLRLSLWLLEFRAARRHGKFYLKSITFSENAPMCVKCGHTFCNHKYDN
jgi:hypothetical protein